MRRRDVLGSAVAAGIVLMVPGLASAGTHYAFVKFEANGATVAGNTDITNIGGETLDRGEWIQCKRVTYGLKRDIGTGARVSGHTHYDRIEFDMPQGPSTPMVMSAGAGQTWTVTVRFYTTKRATGAPVLELKGTGNITGKTKQGETAKVVFDFTRPIAPEVATRAKALAATVGERAAAQPERAR